METQFKRVAKIYKRTFVNADHPIIDQAQSEISEYFDGKRIAFDIPMSIEGSKFQNSVWQQLIEIPCGETTSYDKIATQIKNPKAQRAVGRANGDNRIAIIIPCHRVIRSDGTISGYGGQVWRKKWLIQHESELSTADNWSTRFG